MSELVIPVTISWVHSDSCPCPICTSLDGKTWLISDTELDGPALMDESYGPVYDLDRDVSLAHGHPGPNNCGCFLEAEADLDTPFRKVMDEFEVTKGKNLTDIQQFRLNLRQAKSELGEFRWYIMEVNLVFSRLESLMRRMGLSEDQQRVLATLQKVQMTVMATVNAFYLLRAAQLGAGPLGWFMFATGAIATAFMSADTFASVTEGS